MDNNNVPISGDQPTKKFDAVSPEMKDLPRGMTDRQKAAPRSVPREAAGQGASVARKRPAAGASPVADRSSAAKNAPPAKRPVPAAKGSPAKNDRKKASAPASQRQAPNGDRKNAKRPSAVKNGKAGQLIGGAKKRINAAPGKIKAAAKRKKKALKDRPKRSPEERRKYRRRRIVRLACLVVVCSLAVGLAYVAISCINDILAMNRSTDKVTVSVNDKMTTDEVIDLLAQKELIRNPEFCKLFSQLLGYDDTKYITSVYELQASYGLEKLLVSMSKNAASAETVTLSFPEGYSIEQIFQKLEANEVCSATSLRATAREMDFSEEFPFLKKIANKDQRYYLLEGYLYPDTYEFYVGENAASVIKRFLANFEEQWTEEIDAQAAEKGLTMDRVLTLASIIEKEAYGKEQMYQISSVLHNRLNSDREEFKYLQCDSTSNYVPSIPETILSGDMRIWFTKLYDTYQCVGFPAGPICSPGKMAIEAALDPAQTDYYYFRHDVNKKIYLGVTRADHDRNGDEVLRVNASAKNGN